MYLEALKKITTKLTIYYDGHCPLCVAEIYVLQQHNHQQLLQFENLHTLQDDCEVNCALAMQTMHARLGDTLITGPRVFEEAYQRTDLKWMPYLFSQAWFRWLYAKCYVFFARYRHQISRLIGPLALKLAQKRYAKRGILMKSNAYQSNPVQPSQPNITR